MAVLMLGCKKEYRRKACDDKSMDGTVEETPIPLARGRAIRQLE